MPEGDRVFSLPAATVAQLVEQRFCKPQVVGSCPTGGFERMPQNNASSLMIHDIRALSREWFESVWNQRDDSAIARLASPGVVCLGLGEDRQPAHGFDQFKRFRQGILSAFPDLKVDVQDVLVDGDKSAVRLSFTGTHTGDGIGVPPSSRTFVASAIVILRWQDGRIIEAWNEFDAAGMMRQLQTPSAKLRA
jgi:steroid delta-isomerase-like uncharacterized protein